MKRLLFSFLIISSNLLFGQEVLRLASDIWPPFTSEEARLSISTKIVQTALKRSNRNSQIEITNLNSISDGLKNGVYDGSSALWKLEGYDDDLIYSIPYLQNQLILIGRKDADVSAKKLEELKGMKVGILGLDLFGDEINSNSEVDFIKGESDQENLRRLIEEQLDYILVDALVVQYVLSYKSKEAESFIEIGENVLIRKALHFAVSKNVEEAGKIIAQFNLKILEMIEDGTYNRILNINRLLVDTDQDGVKEMILIGNTNGLEVPKTAYDLSSFTDSDKKEYIIGGKKYKNWEEVPPSFKQPYRPEMIEGFSVLKFKF